MKHVDITYRVKVYLRGLATFLFGLVLAIIAGSLIGVIDKTLGSVVAVILIFACFILLHSQIGSSLLTGNRMKKIGITATIILLFFSWWFFKLWVNTELNAGYFCTGKISDDRAMMNYFGFWLWSPIFLWEACSLLTNRQIT